MLVDNLGASTSSKRSVASNKTKKPRRGVVHRFSNFFVFGLEATLCLGLFVVCYALVLFILWPLLLAETPENINLEERPQDYIHHMHVPPSLREARLPGDVMHDGREKISGMASAMKQQWQKLRQGQGVTDANLLAETMKEFELKRKEHADAKKSMLRKANPQALMTPAEKNLGQRPGFVVLGMHRSGTSMLSGLLHTSCGYTVGGPLIGSAFDNEKGFFERIDVVLQNDQFMNKQRVWWNSNVLNYDSDKALQDLKSGVVDFEKHGKSSMEFFMNPKNVPWMQKDPRMCITLKTWLALLKEDHEPAVVFTYRHPLEVALSLSKREQNFTLEHGLRLWIIYNMRAIQNSRGLCMVRSSNEAILGQPLVEIQRISDELTSKCNVPEPPNRLSQADVDKFIDPNLQHNKKQRALEEAEKEVLREYNDGKCKVYNYDSDQTEGTPGREREEKLYQKAMKIYCDFQSGEAYNQDYEWPQL